MIAKQPRTARALTALVSKLGSTIRAGSVQEAAAQAIVLVAVPWSKIPGALAGLNFDDRIVIDANNSIEAPLAQAGGTLAGRTSTDIFTALCARRARLLKAFNDLTTRSTCRATPTRKEAGGVLVQSRATHMRAKAEVAAIIDRIGFFGIDLGGLAVGSQLVQFPGGPLPAPQPRQVRLNFGRAPSVWRIGSAARHLAKSCGEHRDKVHSNAVGRRTVGLCKSFEKDLRAPRAGEVEARFEDGRPRPQGRRDDRYEKANIRWRRRRSPVPKRPGRLPKSDPASKGCRSATGVGSLLFGRRICHREDYSDRAAHPAARRYL